MRPPAFLLNAQNAAMAWTARQPVRRRASMAVGAVLAVLITGIQLLGDTGAAHSATQMAIVETSEPFTPNTGRYGHTSGGTDGPVQANHNDAQHNSDTHADGHTAHGEDHTSTHPDHHVPPQDQTHAGTHAQPHAGDHAEPTAPKIPDGNPDAIPEENPYADQPHGGFVERGPGGYLPIIRSDGATVAQTWARPPPVQMGINVNNARIGVVVSGLGLSASQTQYAIENLPLNVTLAFSPYAANPQPLVDAAREKGFEVMVEAPSEPFDFPETDPGPYTLLTGVPKRENERRLDWVMSRLAGYHGVVMCEGDRFLTRGDAAPSATQIAGRGVALLTCGDGAKERFEGFAGTDNAPYGHADVVATRSLSREKLDQRLLRLEILALENQAVIGVVASTPMAVDAIAEWSRTLSLSGFALTPTSALLAEQHTTRQTRARDNQLTASPPQTTRFQVVSSTFQDREAADDDGYASEDKGKKSDDKH